MLPRHTLINTTLDLRFHPFHQQRGLRYEALIHKVFGNHWDFKDNRQVNYTDMRKLVIDTPDERTLKRIHAISP